MLNDNVYLAMIGYDTYGKTVDYKNYLGLPMPSWEELPDKIQEGWINAAKAIRQDVVKYSNWEE